MLRGGATGRKESGMKQKSRIEYREWLWSMWITGLTVLLIYISTAWVWSIVAWAGETEATEPESAVAASELEIPAVAAFVAEECFENTTEPEEIDRKLLELLAIGIYREGGGDAVCDQCRLRIGDVMLNRVADDRFPDTLAGVLTQKGQYGTMYWDGITWPDRAGKPEEARAVERARDTAERLLCGEHSELYGQGYIFQSEFPNLGEEAAECCGIYYAKG